MAAALAGVMLFSGCSGVSQDEYNSLLEENSRLQSQMESSSFENSSNTSSNNNEKKIIDMANDLMQSGIEPRKHLSDRNSVLGYTSEWYIYDKDYAIYMQQFDDLSDNDIANAMYIITQWHKLGVDTYDSDGIDWEADYLVYKRKDGTVIACEKYVNEKNGDYSNSMEWSDERVKSEYEKGLTDKSFENNFNKYLEKYPYNPTESLPDGSTVVTQDGIEITTIKTLDNKVCAFITNKGTKTVDELEVQIIYKDQSGNIVDVDDDGHDMVLSNQTVVSRFDTPQSFDTYEVEYTAEYDVHPKYQNHLEECDVKSNLGDDGVIIQITNNSNVEIEEFEYIVVFYKGNDVSSVSFSQDVYDISSKKTIIEKVTTYGIDFDRFEVYVNQAHTFGVKNTSTPQSSSSTKPEKPAESQTPPVQDSATTGERNALKKAQSYLDFSAFSRDGLIGQLEYEGFSNSEATYGADNVGADWNEQAIKKAGQYLEYSAFSYTGLVEQLEFEKFTHEQAVYGVDNCGADWNEQAVKKAAQYLEYSSFSKDGLIGQLEFEGFTHDQAVYGVTQNGY